MAIKFIRDNKGNIIAVDDKTNKKVGSVSTICDTQKSKQK